MAKKQGLELLYNLLLKEAAKQSGARSGIAQIGNVTRDIAEKKFQAFVLGAKKQGVDLDKYTEEELKYILELNKKKLEPRVISADSPEGRGITEALLGRKEGKVIKADFGKPFKEESDEILNLKKIAEEDREIENLYSSAGFGNDQKVDADFLAEYLAENAGKVYDDLPTKERLDFYDRAYNALTRYKKTVGRSVIDEPKKLDPRTKEKIDDIDPEDMATGGRVGLKAGMSKRAFLKLMGGAAAGLGALKTGALKLFGKEGAKKFTTDVVTTAPVPGKPAWFDSLVNKVIREGDDVTKRFATKEREIVHTKKIDEDSTVTVTQDLDEGIVRVEYDSPTNTFEDTVQLQYKKPLPDEGNPNPKAEFTTAESGPVGRQVSPDDYDIDIDEVGGTSIKDLDSDVSKLKEYATGQKPTLKEIVQNKKRKDKAQRITDDPEEQSDAVVRRQGEMLDYDGPDDDFASGGRVGLLSGGGLKGGGLLRVILQNLAEQYGKKPSELLAVTNYKSLPAEVRKFLSKEQFEAIKKDFQEMRVEQFQNIRDMIENRQQFDKSSKALEKMGMNVSDTVLPKMMDKGPVPGGTTPDDLLMMEQIIKNLQMKDRKLNASGGLAGMLGE